VQLAANDRGVARVGFALVGLRSAVQRNLLRRRLREAVRPLLGRVAGHDLVVVAGTRAMALPFAELRATVETAISRVLERAGSAAVASTADNGPMTRSPQADR
jgi:ribonuclease P protein component